MSDLEQRTLISRRDWEYLKTNFPLLAPEGANPEDVGFMLYLSPEQLELLQNLKRRWEGEQDPRIQERLSDR